MSPKPKKEATDKAEPIGRIIWWDFPEGCRPVRGKLDAALEKAGLDKLPEASHAAIAGRTMSRSKAKLTEEWIVEPMGTMVYEDRTPGIVRAYALLSKTEDEKAGKMKAKHIIRILFDTDGKMVEEEAEAGSLREAAEALTAIRDIFAEEVADNAVAEISQYIVDWIRKRGGVSLSHGRPYFAPLTYDDIRTLAEALKSIQWTLGTVAVPDDKASHASILQGATDDLVSRVDKTIKDIDKAVQEMTDAGIDPKTGNPKVNRTRHIKTLLGQIKDIEAQTSRYAELLNSSMEAVQARLEQAQVMMVCVGVQTL